MDPDRGKLRRRRRSKGFLAAPQAPPIRKWRRRRRRDVEKVAPQAPRRDNGCGSSSKGQMMRHMSEFYPKSCMPPSFIIQTCIMIGFIQVQKSHRYFKGAGVSTKTDFLLPDAAKNNAIVFWMPKAPEKGRYLRRRGL